MRVRLRRLSARPGRLRDERGATATEYGLLVGFIAIAIVLAVMAFGTSIADWYIRLAGTVAVIL